LCIHHSSSSNAATRSELGSKRRTQPGSTQRLRPALGRLRSRSVAECYQIR
jgi:hypothetical protein